MITELEAPVPEAFVHKYIDGVPMYVKGYLELGNDAKRVEETKGVGGVHALLATVFMNVLYENFSGESYCLFGGRPGLGNE